MGFWKRSKKQRGKQGVDGSEEDGSVRDAPVSGEEGAMAGRPGVVSGVLSPRSGGDGETPFADVVARRFAPLAGEMAGEMAGEAAGETAGDRMAGDGVPGEEAGRSIGSDERDSASVSASAAVFDGRADETIGVDRSTSTDPTLPRRDHLHAVVPLFSDPPASPALEVDLMAHVGRATTITGNIACEEDLEIQGTVDGSVRLPNHQVTVGNDGHVKASVDANTVIVYGRVTGDVVASDLVEIEKGGIVGGDIKAPRVIMHDGAIVVGTLDMSASLPNPSRLDGPHVEAPERPKLTPVGRTAEIEVDDFDV